MSIVYIQQDRVVLLFKTKNVHGNNTYINDKQLYNSY